MPEVQGRRIEGRALGDLIGAASHSCRQAAHQPNPEHDQMPRDLQISAKSGKEFYFNLAAYAFGQFLEHSDGCVLIGDDSIRQYLVNEAIILSLK